jgi:hypothetical protein
MKMENIDLAALDKDLRKLTQTPKPRGWFRRNWKWAVPLGLLVVVVVGAGVGYWAMFLRVYNLDVCRSAMQAIESDPSVREALGEPIRSVKRPSQASMPSAQVYEKEIDIRWNIEGPKGSAKAHVHANLSQQGKWETKVLEVTLADGKRRPIRAPGDSADDAPPFVPAGQGANPGAQTPGPKSPETKGSDLNIDMPIPPADAPPEAK